MSIRIGIKVKGRAVGACSCLSVLRGNSKPKEIRDVEALGNPLDRSELPHPISPYPLDLDRFMYLSTQFVPESFFVGLIGIFPPTSQASVSSWSLAILKDIIIVIFILGVVDGDGATLGRP